MIIVQIFLSTLTLFSLFLASKSTFNPLKSCKKTHLKSFNWVTNLYGGSSSSVSKCSIIKVVTDIDDTVVSSGGVKIFGIALGGVDNRFSRGQFYPGALQFALELSSAPTIKKNVNFVSKVSVLTARAREFKFALALKPKGKLCSAYRTVGQKLGLQDWGIGDVYYGSVAEWIFQHRKGQRKAKNFDLMINKDDANCLDNGGEKYSYVLIGDTGEKDEEAGERIAMVHGNRMAAVFLHHVYDNSIVSRGLNAPKFPSDRQVNGVKFCYFRTYIGAAVKAYEKKLISREAVQRVTQSTIQELHSIDRLVQSNEVSVSGVKHKKFYELQSQRWIELRKDAECLPFLLKYLPRASSTNGNLPLTSITKKL